LKFKGTYYKHQKGDRSLAAIAGTCARQSFVQVITNDASYYFKQTDKSIFSNEGILLNLQENGHSISGAIQYTAPTPLRYDIMGPFRFLPMQCRHTISSLHHHLRGSLTIDGETLDFTGGTGYIEGDSGTSFPDRYTWLQCSDFPEKACVSVSIATIPFLGLHFTGCIGVVYFRGKEYRLTTYLGVKIIRCDETCIILQQKKLRLEIEAEPSPGHNLLAPQNGKMTRTIRERISCAARFRFYRDGVLLFDYHSANASAEHVGN